MTTTTGLDQAITNASADLWQEGALLAIRKLAATGRGFTTDDVRDLTGEPADPHYWGALFAAARKLKVIEPVGAPIGRDGRPVRVWFGATA